MRQLPVLVALLLVAACGGGGAPPGLPELGLTAITPEPGATLPLNGEIRLTFSESIDPTSVTADSLALVDADTGVPAAGEWVFAGRMLRFVPRGVTSPDLRGGGLAPGRPVRLTLGGFPRIARIQGASGASLAASATFDFAVVGAHDEAPFVDASPDITEPVRLRPFDPGAPEAAALDHDGVLLVACDEPLDPRTLDPTRFEVARVRGAADPAPFGEGAAEDVVPLRALELVQNDRVRRIQGQPVAAALLRAIPARPLAIEPWTGPFPYTLRLRAGVQDSGLRDFSGGAVPWRPVRFLAARFDESTAESAESYAFDFLDADDFAPLVDRTADGTARWAGTGRVEIRYPAAAGDGSERSVTLPDGALERRDLHTTRLLLPEGARTTLPTDGMVVLRAQGRVEIDGTLVRGAPAAGAARAMWDPIDVRRPSRRDPPKPLGAWLRAAQDEGHAWTVIVAGGDLVVTGEIDVDTPLLLVAGGRIRCRGRVSTAPGQLWLLGDGGIDGRVRGAEGPNPAPPLVIDPPVANPLVEPLRFVAYSSPAPKAATPRHWGRPVIASQDGRHGRAQVTFVQADLPRVEGGATPGAYDAGQAIGYSEPMGLLEGRPPSAPGARVRLRVELLVEPKPGAPWDPPLLDRVLLTWTQDPLR